MNTEDNEKKKVHDLKWYTYPQIRNPLIAGVLTGTTFFLRYFSVISAIGEISIYIVAIVLGGYYWIKEGIEELFEEREIGIEILMIAATAGSAILGMWDEASFLVFLYGAAEGLEEYTFTKTRASIRKLLELAPKEALILKDGKEEKIPAENLKTGDLFIVKPGESIPTDGIIVKGRSSINEAPVTGESVPVEKKEGMKVFAATMNQEGALEVKATATFQDNTLSRIIHLVEEAQQQKGRYQLFIEKFGRIYSPIVLLSSLLMIVISVISGGSVSYWATRAVVLLVAAAPCALVMSTPVAIAAGIGRAGKTGVLIKGGIHLENLGKVKAVAFDKTGTLTKGTPVVTDIIAIKDDEINVLKLAYSVEKFSEHSLAKAIVEKAESTGITGLDTVDFKAIAGYRAVAKAGDKNIYVGKQGLFKKFGQNDFPFKKIEKLRVEGKTVVLVGTEDEISGIIAIRDEIRPQAKEIVKILSRNSIKSVILTGDNKITAEAIAKELGIDEVRADLKPEDKLKEIEKLEKEYKVVAMVGDGINDAPALARSTLGIAMGTAGTDAAIEAADIALMADDLRKVSDAISLGKKTKRISNQNIIFSLLVLSVLIPSALIGIMSVAMAVFFHEASELLAVANGLRAGGKMK
ncbi:heavy metal translocating P-type ATPase [candidate division KSB1 bacterium]|nr:MAG: heavy metal translocating P-type ATPase [candidate division KSB1 bacterium]